MHIGPHGRRLLDFARAFTGPGLLDLASWPGTIAPPDPQSITALITAYIQAGGGRLAITLRADDRHDHVIVLIRSAALPVGESVELIRSTRESRYEQ